MNKINLCLDKLLGKINKVLETIPTLLPTKPKLTYKLTFNLKELKEIVMFEIDQNNKFMRTETYGYLLIKIHNLNHLLKEIYSYEYCADILLTTNFLNMKTIGGNND